MKLREIGKKDFERLIRKKKGVLIGADDGGTSYQLANGIIISQIHTGNEYQYYVLR